MIATGQGLLGNNMFAYCQNNPVNFHDPTGLCKNTFSIYFKVDCGRGDCPTSKNFVPFTATFGGGLSVTLGSNTYGIQVALATDAHGDSEIQFTVLTAVEPGTPSVDEMFEQITAAAKVGKGINISGMLSMSFSNAPRVANLHGMGYQAGGTYVAGGAAGVDYNLIPDSLMGTVYHGVTISGGFAGGTSGVHGAMSNTFYAIPVDFSVFDLADACYNGLYGD